MCHSRAMSQCCVNDSWIGGYTLHIYVKTQKELILLCMVFICILRCLLSALCIYGDDADLLVVASETMSANNSSTPIETCFLAGTVYGYSTRFSI